MCFLFIYLFLFSQWGTCEDLNTFMRESQKDKMSYSEYSPGDKILNRAVGSSEEWEIDRPRFPPTTHLPAHAHAHREETQQKHPSAEVWSSHEPRLSHDPRRSLSIRLCMTNGVTSNSTDSLPVDYPAFPLSAHQNCSITWLFLFELLRDEATLNGSHVGPCQ